MKQIVKKIDFLKVVQYLAMFVLLVAPFAAFATLPGFSCDFSSGMNCQDLNVAGLIKLIINWLLGIAFAIAVLFLIIGGFWYITSAGNEETAEKGKNTAVNAIIGIIIIVLAYVIINVIAGLVQSSGNSGS